MSCIAFRLTHIYGELHYLFRLQKLVQCESPCSNSRDEGDTVQGKGRWGARRTHQVLHQQRQSSNLEGEAHDGKPPPATMAESPSNKCGWDWLLAVVRVSCRDGRWRHPREGALWTFTWFAVRWRGTTTRKIVNSGHLGAFYFSCMTLA